jgi:SMC interacting uncharacterized protein involved in chromosome segregation
MNEEMDKPLEDSEVGGPTSIDVKDELISIGPASLDVSDQLNSMEEAPSIEPPQEPQEEKREIEQVQMETRISKEKQKRRRITSYLSKISKQVEKQGNQINTLTIMIQSMQRQNQTKPISGGGADRLQLQSLKEIKSQTNQLQKQVARIQIDIQRIRTASITRTTTSLKSKSRKKGSSPVATVKARSKKGRAVKTTKVRKRGKNK